ncbi:hypothetical protein ElyMa_006552200 [Elysia marginata]|uniref:Uncharacterized protein n=1 Tax=Elysia marginata TaxID=1093978 RepID=A0AAV4IC80_9GAST|nr:hypothetical protein ElyMa_006552200 [Elysia marginata]
MVDTQIWGRKALVSTLNPVSKFVISFIVGFTVAFVFHTFSFTPWSSGTALDNRTGRCELRIGATAEKPLLSPRRITWVPGR